MAEGKKSVLLYCDLIHTVEPLTDEEAGRLFKHYLRYINDQNPCAEDRLTALLFEPIKQNLKRDLKKWEDKSMKNKEIAIAGWEKRKNANASESTKTDANNADTVTVKDTVKVTGIIIPTENDFLDFCKTIKEYPFDEYEYAIKSKYESWVANGWKDGHDSEIKNWKSKIKNTLPHLKPTKKPIKQNYLGGII